MTSTLWAKILPPEMMITVVPDGDPAFPDGAHLTLHRSAVADGTGTGGTPREHVNNITSYLDASNVYGSSQATTDVLRDGAYMITNSNGGAATVSDIEAVHGAGSADGLFMGNPGTAHVMGDIRSDENIALTSIHEIWMKEHNYQVDRLKDLNLGLNDEELFQTARMIVEAEYQKVVYDEWLPELIGHSLPEYTLATGPTSTQAFQMSSPELPSASGTPCCRPISSASPKTAQRHNSSACSTPSSSPTNSTRQAASQGWSVAWQQKSPVNSMRRLSMMSATCYSVPTASAIWRPLTSCVAATRASRL
jgi:hypothetical protein